MDAAIRLDGLVKRFRGREVLSGVDLAVPRGSLYGLIGLNGAGKTTLLRIALGLLRADAGTAFVLGQAVARIDAVAPRVGAQLHGTGLEPALSAADNLRLHALLNGRRADPEPALERLGIGYARDRRAGRLSQGERQRVALAKALLLAPDVLVLDEPLTHLDPGAVHRILEILREEVARGATVLLSSHQLEHVERSSDHLALLHRGRILLSGAMHELLSGSRASLCIEVDAIEAAEQVLRSHPKVAAVERDGAGAPAANGAGALRVTMSEPCAAELNALLHQGGHRVGLLAPSRATLDDLFRERLREADRAREVKK